MSGHVYFLRPVGMDGPIKIGYSQNPEYRLYEYLLWSPFPLEMVVSIPGSMALEDELHNCFIDAHLYHEWFKATPELIRGIEALLRGAPVVEAFNLDLQKVHPVTLRMKKRGQNKNLNRRAEAFAAGRGKHWM